ncbi:Alpha/Beta hydrolase protein [Lipomyces kononenkoae]|uniref:Alpha/Beta hydrolase protein n=1 Tax=Lipomyces kononenkoae TaxID=34357 RepID=A0ACC3T591_LIPKO
MRTSMRSYLFDPPPLPEKDGGSNVSIDEAEDYDFAHLDGVAKEYEPVPEVDNDDGNPVKKALRLLWRKVKDSAYFLGRLILGMSRKQQIILLASTVTIAIILGFTLGYLTPDNEETPGVSYYYDHDHVRGSAVDTYTVTDLNSDDGELVALVNEISADPSGAEQYDGMPDAPPTKDDNNDDVSATGLFGSLFGIRPLFGSRSSHYTISHYQLEHLEEIALLNNIAYCVPSPGITSPFNCTRACDFFNPGVEIVRTFTNTALDTSCTGYIAVDHRPDHKRILLVFRGTNSLTNWFTNLDTIQEPYPSVSSELVTGCSRCMVHRGFLTSYLETRVYTKPILEELKAKYPNYSLLVTGHSLGGAIAILAAADLITDGYTPEIVTYGQPRVGNQEFADWIDTIVAHIDGLMTRVTHRSDPVVRVPLGIEWRHSGGEVYISKGPLAPAPEDCYICRGQEDDECSAGEGVITTLAISGRSAAYRAHVEYFTRVGLCRFQV